MEMNGNYTSKIPSLVHLFYGHWEQLYYEVFILDNAEYHTLNLIQNVISMLSIYSITCTS